MMVIWINILNSWCEMVLAHQGHGAYCCSFVYETVKIVPSLCCPELLTKRSTNYQLLLNTPTYMRYVSLIILSFTYTLIFLVIDSRPIWTFSDQLHLQILVHRFSCTVRVNELVILHAHYTFHFCIFPQFSLKYVMRFLKRKLEALRECASPVASWDLAQEDLRMCPETKKSLTRRAQNAPGNVARYLYCIFFLEVDINSLGKVPF